MSQLHVAMLHLHNGLVDRLRSDGVAEAELFAEARRAATWHYQWVLLADFLPRLVGAELAGELLAGGARHYRPAPERPGSRWSSPTPPTATATARSATATRSTATPSRCRCCPTCSASARSRRSWRSTGRTCSTCPAGRPAQRAKRIDGRLAASLIQLPAAVTGVEGGDDYGSLAVRDLQRGQGRRAAVGRGACPPTGGRAAHPRGGRPWPGRLAAGDAALVLPAQGGRAPRRGRAAGPGGRPPGRRGPGRHRRRRRRVVPGRGPRLAPHARGRPAGPVRSGRPAGLHHRGGGSGRSSRAWAGRVVRGTAGVVPTVHRARAR